MAAIMEKQAALIQEFSLLSQWEDRYKRIIELGKTLPVMPDSLKTEDNKIRGCQSQVWLSANLNERDEIILVGDSDALLVKGLVALLLRIYSGSGPDEILVSPPEFLKVLGFEGNLSPSRANGLHAMLKQIQLYAQAFRYLIANKK